MKKVIGLFVGLVAMLLPTVAMAATEMPDAVDGKITLTEDVTLSAGYIVKSGEDITLDLAGFTLTSETKDTVYVEKGASLKIVGSGTLTNEANGYAPLFNNGTVVIDGDLTIGRVMVLTSPKTYSYTSDTNSSYYAILNHGTMTIENATVKELAHTNADGTSVSGHEASLIANGYYNYTSTNERLGHIDGVNEEKPTLTINGGTFDGGMNTVKNDDNGVLEINDGTFQNNYQVSLMNWNEATINDGTFNTPTGNDKTNIAVGSYGANSVDKGVLIINGGTFNAEHLLESSQGYPVYTPVEINGGTFNYTDTFFNESLLNTSLENNGVEIVGEVTAPKSALAYAKSGAIVNLTDAELGDVLSAEEGVYVTIPDVGVLALQANEDGTLTVVKSADLTKLEEIINTIANLNEEDYTEESAAILTKALEDNLEAILNPNFTSEEQDKVDALVSELENAVAALVKKSDAETPSEPSVPSEPTEPVEPSTPSDNVVENPKTGDSILSYMVLGIISMFGASYAIVKKFN